MARKKLVLMASKRMDTNKKEERNENGLIRMSAAARENMGFNGKVELWPDGASGADRTNKSIMLTVFHAFKDDIAELKNRRMSEEKKSRVGFVTTKMFKRLVGDARRKAVDNIWISNDIHDTVIGTDPEFLIVEADRYKVVHAQNLLGKIGDFGGDGAMAEIRPKPEVSVDQLVSNMVAIFKAYENDKRVKNYRWMATCWHQDDNRGYPVGGHIHVGNPVQLMNQTGPFRSKFYKVLNKIMDEYLSMPLVKLDGPDGKYRRQPGAAPMGPFGHYGGHRTDLGRLEHRTLSGIWILHPSLSKAVLGCAKAVIDETFRLVADNGFKANYVLPGDIARRNIWSPEFDSWDEVGLAVDMGCATKSGDIIEVLNNSDHTYWTKAKINSLHGKFKKLSTYKENSHYIDGFCEILKVKFEEFDGFDKEIKGNWLGDKKFIVSV